MGITKKFISFILTAVLLLTMAATINIDAKMVDYEETYDYNAYSWDYDETTDDYQADGVDGDFYYYIWNYAAVLRGYNGVSGDVVIPDTLDGYPVTSIEGYTFDNCSSLESITIPDSVTEIGPYSFKNCTSLKNITIPGSVTSIGGSAFLGCVSLESVTLSEGLTCIEHSTFANCANLKEIIIPESVKKIGSFGALGEQSFEGCIRLEKVVVLNADCEIDIDKDVFPENAVLYGFEGSTLEEYAETWNREFRIIGSEDEGGEEGKDEDDDIILPHIHKYPDEWITLSEASCSQTGIMIKICEKCNNFITEKVESYGHSDNDGDGKCDECKVLLSVEMPEEPTTKDEPTTEDETTTEKEPTTEAPTTEDSDDEPVQTNPFLAFFENLFDKLMNFLTKLLGLDD